MTSKTKPPHKPSCQLFIFQLFILSLPSLAFDLISDLGNQSMARAFPKTKVATPWFSLWPSCWLRGLWEWQTCLSLFLIKHTRKPFSMRKRKINMAIDWKRFPQAPFSPKPSERWQKAQSLWVARLTTNSGIGVVPCVEGKDHSYFI